MRPIKGIGLSLLDSLDNIHTLYNLTKNRIATIQIRCSTLCRVSLHLLLRKTERSLGERICQRRISLPFNILKLFARIDTTGNDIKLTA